MMDARPAWSEDPSCWRPWFHGVWADLTLLSAALMRIQEMVGVGGVPWTPAATPARAAGTDWLQAYA